LPHKYRVIPVFKITSKNAPIKSGKQIPSQENLLLDKRTVNYDDSKGVTALANTVAPIQYGWDYQSFLFWIKACALICKQDKIARVGYEVNSKTGFDDVAVFYNDPIFLGNLKKVDSEFYQLKNHMTLNGSITLENLMDPAFINATSLSLLQRLKKAREDVLNQPEITSPLFIFFTPWPIDPNDILAELGSGNTPSINTSILLKKGPTSKMGKLRNTLKNHLNIVDDRMLIDLFDSLVFKTESLESLMERLSHMLFYAGLRPLDRTMRSNLYTEAARAISKGKQRIFNREEIINYCKEEHLWVKEAITETTMKEIHIRSFSKFVAPNTNTEKILDLTEYFDHPSKKPRCLSKDKTWGDIAQRIEAGTAELFYPGDSVCLNLDTHLSIAFGLGYCLSPKSGVAVAIKQKGENGTREFLFSELVPSAKTADLWKQTTHDFDDQRSDDLAVAIGITHPVERDVSLFLTKNSFFVRKLKCFEIVPEPCATAMRDVAHCIQLSKSIFEEIKNSCDVEGYSRVHLFMASPVSFAFHLGRKFNALGYKWQLYEHAFDKDGIERTYTPSLSKEFF
jgi:hypothetical protein